MPKGPPAHSPSEARMRGLVLHPQEDELLLANRLPLFDQHVAIGEGVEVLFTWLRAWSRSRAVTSGS